MDVGKTKSIVALLKKYTPNEINFKKIGDFTAYQRGYMRGYLIRTGKLKEVEELLKKR